MRYLIIRSFVFATILSIFISTANAQANNSDDRMFTFIKVWGFLKYYHPALASGNVNADSLFTANIEKVHRSTPEQFKKELAQIISSLGVIPSASPADTTTLFKRNQHFDWIYYLRLIPSTVAEDLKRLSINGYTGSHRFMPATFHDTQLPGEDRLENILFPEKHMQWLVLARYWNAIEYLYPYKYLLSIPWDETLRQHIRSFDRILSSVELERQLLKLNAAIQDSHAGSVNIKNKAQIYGTFFPPFYSRFVGDSLVVTDIIDTLSCRKQNIQAGDIIYAIKNGPVTLKDREWYVSASNLNKKKSIMSSPQLMFPLRGKDSVVTIGYLRKNKRLQRRLELQKPSSSQYVAVLTSIYLRETGNGTTTTNDFILRSIDSNIAIVDAANLSIFYNSEEDESKVDSIMSLMRNHKKAIIIDLRCYATQAVFYNKLLSALGWQLKPFISLKAHSTRFPGAFYERDLFTDVKQEAIQSQYQGKVMLLVDSRTHSQSEMITMILQASGPAITIGTQSSGADGDIIYLPIPGAYTMSFSGRHVSYLDGDQSQMTGVRRNIKVKITTKGLAAGRDEILEAALDQLRGRQ